MILILNFRVHTKMNRRYRRSEARFSHTPPKTMSLVNHGPDINDHPLLGPVVGTGCRIEGLDIETMQ